MPLSIILSEAVIDIAKKFAFEVGKKIAHGFKESATGNQVGQIINYRYEEAYNNVVLFVHGFSGDASETFGHTPDLLINTPEFHGWDIFSIGYSSDIFPSIGKGLWSVNPDITKISKYLRTLLKNQFGDYDRVTFVAHSMGGLAVQRAILDLEAPYDQKISHVLLFGTPSNGLEKAYWFRFWNTQAKDLSSKSKFIENLRIDWKAKFGSKLPFKFKTIAGSTDEFVPTTSSLEPFAKKYHGVIEGNHINMIKPINENDTAHQSYRMILNGLVATGNSGVLKGNPEEKSIVLGEYHTVINKFLPIAGKIAKKELAQLVFALENTTGIQEALRVLEAHPQFSEDSDTLGIIGGRFKRLYLLNGLEEDLQSSVKFYTDALAHAKRNNDKSQIFYQAINLAFLSLVGENDRKKMAVYAQLALDNCVSEFKDMWELATMAEANMYLGDLTKAETFYRKTAEVAGTDIRAKQSIYSNAYYGYQSVMATKDKKANFIKMLEEVFLS